MDYTRHFNKVIILSFALFAASTTLSFAWTEPTLTPPSGNVSAPINTSATTQTKSGALNVSGAFTAASMTMTNASNGGFLTFSPSNNAQTIIHDYNNGNTAGFGMNAFGAGYCGALFHTGSAKVTWCNNGGLALGTYAATTNAPANTLIVNSLGVGTSSPATTLSVAGTIYSSTGGFKFPDGTTQTTAGGGGGSSQWTTSGSNIYYNTGSVGIGATSPGSALHVTGSNTYAGSGLLLGSAGVASGYLWTTDNLYIKPNTTQGNASGGIYIQDFSEATKFAFNTNTGNFGIGTVTPKAPLQAYSAVVTTATQVPASSGTTPLNPMARFDNNRGEVLDIGGQWGSPYAIWLQATDAGALGTTYPLLLNPNGGNVGIGTASPHYKLETSGSLGFNGGGYYHKALTSTYMGYSASYRALMIGDPGSTVQSNDNAVTVAFNYDPSINASGSFGGNGSEIIFRNGTKFLTPNSGDTSFNTNLTLKDGSVGIGITAPGEMLHIGDGVTQVSPRIKIAGSTDSGINQYVGTTFVGQFKSVANDILITNVVSNDDADILLKVKDTIPVMTIKGSGNVGIGTTNPQSTMSVNGSARLIGTSVSSVTLGFGTDDGVSGWSIGNGIIDNTHNFRIYDNTAGLTRVTVDGSGNVGIGTTAPGSLLTVNGKTSLLTFTETISATGNSGASATINFALGSVNTITLTANTTLSFSNAAAGQSVTIFLKQDATGSRTVTWPTMLWSAATAPTLTTTANKTDIVTVFYDGTSYYGFLGGTNY